MSAIFYYPAYKDEMEDEEGEMEIGYPTDVKHLTHKANSHSKHPIDVKNLTHKASNTQVQ